MNTKDEVFKSLCVWDEKFGDNFLWDCKIAKKKKKK